MEILFYRYNVSEINETQSNIDVDDDAPSFVNTVNQIIHLR